MTLRAFAMSRAATGLVLALACVPAGGCGARRFSRHAALAMPAPAAAARAQAADAARDPRDPWWPYRDAEAHVAADSLASAEADLRRALALDPTYAPALALLSKLEFDSGRSADAMTLLEPVRRQPDAYAPAARTRLLAGLALHADAVGDTARAHEALANVLDAGGRQDASVPVYLALRGDAPETAAPLAREAVRHDGHSAVNQNNLGITLLRAGDVEGARKAFAEAIARDPALPGPYYNLAILEKWYRFDDEAAARAFAEYAKRSQDDPDGLRAVFAAPAAHPDAGARP